MSEVVDEESGSGSSNQDVTEVTDNNNEEDTEVTDNNNGDSDGSSKRDSLESDDNQEGVEERLLAPCVSR